MPVLSVFRGTGTGNKPMTEALAALYAAHERWFDHYFSVSMMRPGSGFEADAAEYSYHIKASSALFYLIHDRKWGYELGM